MTKSLIVGCLILISQFSNAQQVAEGKVVSQKSKQPVPFANIGIINSSIGTISNEDGSFALRIPEKWLHDSITFSSLGYEVKRVAVREFLASPITVFLTEQPVVLKEVNVTGKKVKAKIFQLGNTAVKGGVLQTDTAYSGRSMALLIENKNPKTDEEFPLYLNKAHLRILRNNLPSFRFRVRINEVDQKTGMPGNDLLQQGIIVESVMRSGWLEFDLSPLNMIVTGPFFVTFEQLTTKSDRMAIANGYHKFMNDHPDRVKYDTVIIEGKKTVRQVFKRGGIDVPGTFIGIGYYPEKFTCYVREVSLGNWEKVRGIVSATVEFSTQAPAKKRP